MTALLLSAVTFFYPNRDMSRLSNIEVRFNQLLHCRLYHLYSQWWEHSMPLANLLRLQALDRNKKVGSSLKLSYHISLMGLQYPKHVQHLTCALMCLYIYASMYTYIHTHTPLHKICVVDLTPSLMLSSFLLPLVRMPILIP